MTDIVSGMPGGFYALLRKIFPSCLAECLAGTAGMRKAVGLCRCALAEVQVLLWLYRHRMSMSSHPADPGKINLLLAIMHMLRKSLKKVKW